MVDLPSSPLALTDPDFEEMALQTGDLTFGLPGTTPREKLLQVTAHDICRAGFGLPFKMHVMGMHMHGVPYVDMLALIRFVAVYAGYPSAAGALGAIGPIADELGIERTTAPSRQVDDQPGVTVPVNDPWLAGFIDSRMKRAWSEARLSLRERAFVALTAHVTQHSLGASFRRHAQLAVEIAGADDVRDAIRFTAEMGITEAAAALAELENLLTAQEGTQP
ncbi:MAG TPA: hypothetical protein VG497_20855 [Kribbella sp.]|nr:hypothetical protein [Kribbella sp.]